MESIVETLEYKGCRIAVSLHQTDSGGYRAAITVSCEYAGSSSGITRIVKCPGLIAGKGLALARAHAVAVAWIDENWV